jgi:hypothetical protein
VAPAGVALGWTGLPLLSGVALNVFGITPPAASIT